MSTPDLERELTRTPAGESVVPPSVVKLTTKEALEYRNAGNLPDELGRTLRLVLHVDSDQDLETIEARRGRFEPDYMSAPTWRREGSAPVNVVPVRDVQKARPRPRPWVEDPKLASLEEEWASSGSLAGMRVPGEYRGFVYKTVLAMQAAGRPITAEAVADSIARWVPPDEAEKIRRALIDANR